MSDIDWTDRSIPDETHIMMVDPHNLNIVRGELEHLVLSECSLSFGYNTDTRTSGQIATLESNYITNSWLRVIHKHGDYQEELGTYIVSQEPDISMQNGSKKYTYQLQSVLWTLSQDYTAWHYSIGEGAYALDVFDSICKLVGRDKIHSAGVRNYRYSSSKVYDIGESFLSILFDICDISNNRLDVDGHGRITIAPYFVPAEVTPSWDIDADSKRTMLLNDSISISTSSQTIPTRALVTCTNGDNEITGYAERDSSSIYSSAQRGFTITNKYQVSDMEPKTGDRAVQLAKQYLAQTDMTKQLKCSMLYFPCKCGETMYLTLNGERKKYQIQSIDPINLDDFTMSLTLKEV